MSQLEGSQGERGMRSSRMQELFPLGTFEGNRPIRCTLEYL
jgi:hypothetical protein